MTPTGTYAAAPKGSSRSPCPVVNALANHGYLQRSGRSIRMSELNAAMAHVGMSGLLGAIFAKPTYIEFQDPIKLGLQKPLGLFARLWRLLKNPYSFFSYFGCWRRGQVDRSGKKVIDLSNLAIHGAIEHDISITRRDFGQKKQGNCAAQEDLIEAMLACSSDGGKTLSIQDLGDFVKYRIEQQLEDNPELVYGPNEHTVNCGQLALLMHCFGDGQRISCEYVRALFVEERLPWKEGWQKRSGWWSVGLVEFFGAVKKIRAAVGVEF